MASFSLSQALEEVMDADALFMAAGDMPDFCDLPEPVGDDPDLVGCFGALTLPAQTKRTQPQPMPLYWTMLTAQVAQRKNQDNPRPRCCRCAGFLQPMHLSNAAA